MGKGIKKAEIQMVTLKAIEKDRFSGKYQFVQSLGR